MITPELIDKWIFDNKERLLIDMSGLTPYQLKCLYRYTGSKAVWNEYLKQVSRYGNLVKDEHGNLI